MTPLPYDYARCMTPCELATVCRRTTPGRTPQSYTQYPGGDDCHGLILEEPKT